MSFLLNLIISHIADSVTSWKTTIPAGVLASVTAILVKSGIFDPDQINSIAGQLCQLIAYLVSFLLLCWQDRKEDPADYTPTPGPKKDT